MRNVIAIVIGAVMLLAASLLAVGSSNQDTAPRPQVAARMETELHRPPNPTPTETSTAVPTVTPIPGWTKSRAGRIELWLPENYEMLQTSTRVTVRRVFEQADPEGTLVLLAYDSRLGLTLPLKTIEVIRIETTSSPDVNPVGMETGYGRVDMPHPVSLGRYAAYRGIADAPPIDYVHMRKLYYWIRQSDAYWLLIYTSPAYEFNTALPDFETSARSFSVLDY